MSIDEAEVRLLNKADEVLTHAGALDQARAVRALRETTLAQRETLRAVNDNALDWHAGEDGKARALNVIAVWTAEALAGRVHPSVELISASRAS